MERENGPVAVLEVPEHDTAAATTTTTAAAGGADITGKRGSKARRGGVSETTGPILSDISFSRKQRGMVAASDLSGDVHIWRLGWSLTTARSDESRELERLEQMGSGRG